MNRQEPPGRKSSQTPVSRSVSRPQSKRPPAQAVRQPAPPHQPALSAERLIRIEKRKARSRAVALSIFVLAIMLVTVLMIIAVMKQAKPSPRFIFIQEGSLSHTVQSTGLIIRSETPFNAPASGLLKPLTTEGSRAAKKQKLALIIPKDRESQLLDLQKCEKDIVDLQTELMSEGKGAGAQAIFDESAASLASVINLVRSDASKGTLANLNAYATSISVILEQRATKLATINFNDARLDTLNANKAALENSLGLDSGTLYCETPGIVSFKLDGLESLLNPDTALTLTKSDYEKYISQAAQPAAETTTVSKGQPVVRVASSLSQYLVLLLPDTDASLFKLDDFTEISIPADGVKIENCRVLRSDAEGKDTLVVFRTDRKVEWLANRRTFQAELVVAATTGLKVPVAALTDYDDAAGQASLMIVDEGYTRTCKVKVVDLDREYAIIEAIDSEKYKPEISTVLVVNPGSIEAGEFIGQ